MAVHMHRSATVSDDQTTVERDVIVERSNPPTPSTILSLGVGAIYVIIGVVALLRGDITGSWREPVVDVVGISHTPLLGLIDIGAGILLLLGVIGGAGTRVFAGVVVGVAGAIQWIEAGDLRDDLAAPWGFGAAAVVAGGLIALLAALEGDRRSVVRTVVDE